MDLRTAGLIALSLSRTFSWKSERQVLSAIELQESVRSAASPLVDTANFHLSKVQLNDPAVKFEVHQVRL